MSLSPGSKLGPYEIIDLIGSGGMGEVWKARDTRLGRIVAIKKVKEQHSDRFRQEAKSIAALNNPHICQIFDIGPDYLVLEYIDGKPLSCPLPERETVRLAIQIATAIEAAHKKGIIHRDLKPGNIMVTDENSVKLLDFGLAKLYEQDGLNSNVQTAEFPLTQAGAVLGTVAYMSPEQAQGQPADARSDIFAFGLVLYEMLSGRRAFSGESPNVTVAGLLRDEPPPLKASSSIQRIVSQCLAKQPSARYQAISEVKTALEQVSREMEAKSSAEPQPSIAVLPFVDMSPGKDNEWFSDGLAEEIINVLAQIPGLRVTARTSAFAFRGKEQDIRKIAETLGVRTILEGSVRRADNRIRVTAQLINADDGYHLWSQRYDREMKDVFAIQDEIAAAISKALQVKLSVDAAGPRQYTPNLPAYEAYLRARHYFGWFTPESLARSRQHAEQAIALDPGFAQPHIQIGDCLLALAIGWSVMPAHEAMPKIREEARKALEIDPSLPEAQAMLGIVAAVFDYDWKESGRRFAMAMARDPVPRQVRAWYGVFYLWPIGRIQEAVEELERACKEDPLDAVCRSTLATGLLALRRYEDANREIRKNLELDENLPLAHYYLGVSYVSQGRYEEALACAERSHSLAPWYKPAIGLLAGLLARTGQTIRAQELVTKLGDGQEYGTAFSLADFHLLCGEIDKAADWLEKAIGQRQSIALFWIMLPYWKVLKSSPRCPALMKLLNLPEWPAL
jgi:serine/threonine protein kinase/Tfp pilus assembly protein PilF